MLFKKGDFGRKTYTSGTVVIFRVMINPDTENSKDFSVEVLGFDKFMKREYYLKESHDSKNSKYRFRQITDGYNQKSIEKLSKEEGLVYLL